MDSKQTGTPGRLYLILSVVISSLLAIAVIVWVISNSEVTGKSHLNFKVIDGDTVQIGNASYDLFGIDTPELGQVCFNGSAAWHCGLDAAGALHRRIAFDPPDCRPAPAGSAAADGRPKIICNTGGTPAAIILLEEGYAIALDQAPASYKKAQKQARHASLGLWRGKFIPPAAWRGGTRLEAEAAHAPPCPVKAVAAQGGGKIYYTPLDKEYPAIRVESAKGGKCFGSDEAAREAGYSHHSAPGGM